MDKLIRVIKELIVIEHYFGCPYLGGTPKGCQYKSVRILPYTYFIDWIARLPDDELDQLIINHKKCPHNDSKKSTLSFIDDKI